MTLRARTLLGPGPSNPYPEAQAALGFPLLGHLDPLFLPRWRQTTLARETIRAGGVGRTVASSLAMPRKVRAPQGTVPGNAWAARADGKCNRKIPPNGPAGCVVRVKWCGKSAPRVR